MKKLVLFFSLIGLGLPTLAKIDGQLPFLYLNQYFTYSIATSSEIIIAEKSFDFKNFGISNEDKNTVFNLESLNQWLIPGSKLGFKNKENMSLGRISLTKGKSSYRVQLPQGTASVCLFASSAFSDFQFCKSISSVENTTLSPKVSVNGELVDNAGTVVLKDKEESLIFSAVLSAESSVLLKTKKRNVLPSTITKSAADNFLTIQFADQSLNVNNTWTEKINVDQSYIVLQLDPLISMRQDLYFNKPNLKTSAWNYSSSQALKSGFAGKIDEDGLVTEVFGIYSGLKGESSTVKVSLNSDLGKGVRSTYKWPMNAKTRGFLQGYVYQTSIISDANNGVINPQQFPFALSGGAEYQLWNRWSILGQGRLHKDLFFKTGAGSSVEVFTGLNTELSLTPVWEIFRTSDSKWLADLGLSFLYSTDVSAAGYKYQLGTSYVRKIDLGQFVLSGYYSSRSQNTSANSFTEQLFFYGAGYHYSF